MHRRIVLAVALASTGCGKKATEATGTATGEAQPLTLEVSEPAQAAHLPVGPLTLKGTQTGLVGLTVNGTPADDADEAWSHDIDAVRGVNAFEVTGTNAEGTIRRLVRQSVLAGSFGEPAGAVDEALGLRVNRGGLDSAAGYAATLLDPVVLSQQLTAVNPVYDSWLATVNVGSIQFGPPDIDLVPSQGALAVSLVLPDVELWLPSDIALFGEEDVWVTCDSARVAGGLTLGTDGQGHLAVGLVDASVELVNFEYDTSIIDGDVLALFDGTIQGVLEDELLLQMNTVLPELLGTQLSSLELAFDLDLLGTQASIGTSFAHAFVDSQGVLLVADLEVEVASAGTKLAPGYLLADAGQPTPDTQSDVSMALSDDLVNRLLFEAWSGGMLDLALTSDDDSLPVAYLSELGANDEAHLTLDARLPPVLVQKGDRTELQIGELDLHLETPGGDLFDYLDVAMSAAVPVDLEVVDGELTIALGAPELDFVVRDTDWRASNEQITALLEDELPIDTLVLLLGSFSFPLPSLAGFTLDNAAIERDASEVFTNVAVTL